MNRPLPTAAALFLALTLATLSRADPLDPKPLLPTLDEGDSCHLITIKLPPLLKLDAFKSLRKDDNLDEELAKLLASATLDDISELVLISHQIRGDRAPKLYAIFHFTKEFELKDLVPKDAKSESLKSPSGFELLKLSEKDSGPTAFLAKLAPDTFLYSPKPVELADVETFLKRAAAKKPAKTSDAFNSAARNAGPGDITVVSFSDSKDQEDPDAFAYSLKLGETLKLSIAAKFKSEDAANAAAADLKEHGFPLKLPALDISTDGDLLKASASASKEESPELLHSILKFSLP